MPNIQAYIDPPILAMVFIHAAEYLENRGWGASDSIITRDGKEYTACTVDTALVLTAKAHNIAETFEYPVDDIGRVLKFFCDVNKIDANDFIGGFTYARAIRSWNDAPYRLYTDCLQALKNAEIRAKELC